MERILSLAAAFLAASFSATCLGQAPLTETTVEQGKIRGVEENGFGSFKAIPFAEAPIGALRWKAPVPKKPWPGTFDASKFGAIPPQKTFSFQGRPAPVTSEDCLYLNILTPAKKADEGLPVLVWIHGGGFITGDANSMNGDNFAKQGIVFASISYRTGALGFLSIPELSSESPEGTSGNYGLLDMILALQWIKTNISAFGGDPAKVTIMGESAGAIAVSMLCASPLADGLFRGAISESGGSFCPVDSVRTDNNGIRDQKGAEKFGLEFMKRMGASSLSELRAMSPDKWIGDEPSIGVGGFWPTVDGKVIIDDQYILYENGRYNDVAVLIGTNSDEGAMFCRPENIEKYRSDIKKEYGVFADKMLELYPASTDEDTFGALSDIFRETAFAWPTYAWATLQRKTGKGKVFMYYFDQFNEKGGMFNRPGVKPRGANHASELPFVFGHSWGPQSESDKVVSEAMQKYWGNFVKYGDPNGDGLDRWPEYDASEATVMKFKNGTSLIETPNMPQLQLMDEYFRAKREARLRMSANSMRQRGPQGGFEAPLPYEEVYRDDNVVFRKLNSNTWIGSGHVMASETLYIIEGKKKAMLLDTGTNIEGLDKIVAKITDKPVICVLTHVHPDHAGSVKCFDEVWLNAADTVNMPMFMPGYEGKVRYLKNGQKFHLGGRTIEVFFTPGHTPGSTTFLDEKAGYGFSGDSFGNGNLLLTTDFSTLRRTCHESAAYFKKKGVTKFYNGHFFGNNPETIKRINDLEKIADDVLSGRIEGNDNPQGMAGLNKVIFRDGVRVNYSDRQVK